MKKIKFYIIYLFAILLPNFVSAQGSGTGFNCTAKYAKSLQGYVCEIYKIIGEFLIPILNLAAFAFFLFNVVQYIRFLGNEKKRVEYRKAMIYSVIALFVMVSIWGIINIFGEILGINTSVVPQVKY